MVQNLWWAAGYSIVAIPAAAGLFARWDFVLSPAVAAVLMSASTVIVALNAQLLRRARRCDADCRLSSQSRPQRPAHRLMPITNPRLLDARWNGVPVPRITVPAEPPGSL